MTHTTATKIAIRGMRVVREQERQNNAGIIYRLAHGYIEQAHGSWLYWLRYHRQPTDRYRVAVTRSLLAQANGAISAGLLLGLDGYFQTGTCLSDLRALITAYEMVITSVLCGATDATIYERGAEQLASSIASANT